MSNSAMPSGSPNFLVSVFGSTNVGVVRSHNEDNFLVADLTAELCNLQPEVRNHKIGNRGSLFMVADGMGGGAAGEVASQLAINTVYEHLLEQVKSIEILDKLTFARKLKEAVEHTNSVIHQESRSNSAYKGMGTTISAAGFLGGTLYLAQVGDSRAYLVRRDTIKQVTKDQSLVNKLLDAGLITEEEAETHENKNVILQALGVSETVDVVVSSIDLRRDDALVLCSDGLSGLVKAEEIRQVVDSCHDQVAACRALIDMANQRGGYDNITVIIARFAGDKLLPAAPEDVIEYTLFDDTAPTTAKIQGSPTAPVEKKNSLDRQPSRVRKFALPVAVLLALAGVAALVWALLDTAPVHHPAATEPTVRAQAALNPASVQAAGSPADNSAAMATEKKVGADPVSKAAPTHGLARKSVDAPPAVSTFNEATTQIAGRDNQAVPATSQDKQPLAEAPPPNQPATGAVTQRVASEPPEAPGEKSAGMAGVTVLSEPVGISFTVDGEEILRSTPAQFQLTVGRHTLKFRFGPILITKEVEVKPDVENRFAFLIDSAQKASPPPP